MKNNKPVQISGGALHALSTKVRQWSGWKNATLVFDKPDTSPFAECDHPTRTFTVNVDELVLNPNRVLLSITPFRLRQEAILTGCLLHESAHARHSLWRPRNAADRDAWTHSDGEPVTAMTEAFACLMEEPRVEGLLSREADTIGATGLAWTMRAATARLIPLPTLSQQPDQRLMDFIEAWALRAGKQIALEPSAMHNTDMWVKTFTSNLHKAITDHLMEENGVEDQDDALRQSAQVIDLLVAMIWGTDDTGKSMIDNARTVLSVLFPETDGDSDDAPMPGGCAMGDPDEGESGEGEAQADESDAEDDDSEGEGSGSDDDESDAEDGDDDGEGDESDGEAQAMEAEAQAEKTDAMQQMVEAMVERANESAGDEQADSEAAPENPEAGTSKDGQPGGSGEGGILGGNFRSPTPDERDIQKGAEKFLRDLVDPTETTKVSLSEQPSALVDGAALSAWRAAGATKAPQFFVRSKRESIPAAPVQVATLVDVSGSMEELQKPSARLSWALSAAALDLRNFAGRGQQVESTLIHWGDTAEVIQANGAVLPGIREVPCWQGTSGLMHGMRLAEEQIPGFFDMQDRPTNRLLVIFTDWQLGWRFKDEAYKSVSRALAAGVNILSVVPSDFQEYRSDLKQILASSPVQRGRSTVLKYRRSAPGQVWEQAAKALSQ